MRIKNIYLGDIMLVLNEGSTNYRAIDGGVVVSKGPICKKIKKEKATLIKLDDDKDYFVDLDDIKGTIHFRRLKNQINKPCFKIEKPILRLGVSPFVETGDLYIDEESFCKYDDSCNLSLRALQKQKK